MTENLSSEGDNLLWRPRCHKLFLFFVEFLFFNIEIIMTKKIKGEDMKKIGKYNFEDFKKASEWARQNLNGRKLAAKDIHLIIAMWREYGQK